jgi:hypothetical protein
MFAAKAQCDYTLEMTDAWGDGWDNAGTTGGVNTMDVLVNGVIVLDDVFELGGSGQNNATTTLIPFNVDPGDDITVVWSGGGLGGGAGAWEQECSYRILDSEGNEVVAVNPILDGGGDILSGTITAVCPNATCPGPAGFINTFISDTEASITFDDPNDPDQDNYEYELVDITGGGTPTGTTTNSTTTTIPLTGLTRGNEYRLIVFTECGSALVPNPSAESVFNFFHITVPDCVTDPVPATGTDDVSTAASFSWTPPVGGDAPTSYDFYLTGPNDAAGVLNNIGNVPGPPVNITGLDLGAQYGWAVVPVNATGANDTCLSTVNTFTVKTPPSPPAGITCTSGNPSFIAYSDELDAQGAWTGDFANGNGTWNFGATTVSGAAGPTGPQSGTAFMYYEASVPLSIPEASAVSPAIDLTFLTPGDPVELSFFLHAFGPASGTLTVGVGTDVAGPFTTEFTWEGSLQGAQVDPFLPVGVDLSAYNGQTIFLEFKNVGSPSGGFVGDTSIDLIEINACTDACVEPSGVVASNFQTGQVDLDWNDSSGANSYDFEIQNQGVAQGDGGAIVASTNVAVSEALAVAGAFVDGNDYTLYVRTNCTADSSPYTSIDFTFTPPQPGDDCDNAIVATEGTVTGAQINAAGGAPSLWYVFTAPADGFLTVDSCGGGVDSVLQIYSGPDCDTLTLEGANDDSCEVVPGGPNFASALTDISVTAGTDYYIVWLDSYPTSSNPFDWTLTFVNPLACNAPTNGSASNFQTGLVDLDWDDNATAVTFTYEIQDQGVGQGTAGAIVANTTTADATSEALAVAGAFVEGNSYTVYIASNCAGPETSDYASFDFTFVLPPPNDEFANAESLTVGSSCSNSPGTLLGGTESVETPPTCASFDGPDVWYSFTAPANGNIFIDLSTGASGTPFDTGMSLYSYDSLSDTLTQIQCNDDGANGTFSSIVVTDGSLTPGATYYARVWAFNAPNAGDFAICAYSPDCPGQVKTWSGTEWQVGGVTVVAPTAIDTAIIGDSFGDTYNTEIDGNIDACSIIVSFDATLNVDPLTYASIDGDITVSGTLNVLHTGSVVQVSPTAVTSNGGTINVEITTPEVGSRSFMLIGSPMSTADRGDFAGFKMMDHDTNAFDMFIDENLSDATNFVDLDNNDWTNFTGTLTPGKGYIYWPGADILASGTYDVLYNNGTLNNGDISYPTIFGSDKNDSPNMLSNPYPSALNTVALIASNDAIDEVYFWEHNTVPNATFPGANTVNFNMEDISIRNAATGVPSSTGGTAPGQFMSTAQGFGIKAADATPIVFTNSMRSTANNDDLRSPLTADRLWLNVISDEYERASNLAVVFTENATAGYDAMYDSQRIGTVVSMYTQIEGSDNGYTIQSREAFTNGATVTAGFSSLIDENTTYTVSMTDRNGDLMEEASIFLIDNELNTITDLTITNYTFESVKGNFPGRFTIVFENEALGTNDFDVTSISMYPNPAANVLTIASPNAAISLVEVRDIRGRVVLTQGVDAAKMTTINVASLDSAVYLVTVTTLEGTITSRLIKE